MAATASRNQPPDPVSRNMASRRRRSPCGEGKGEKKLNGRRRSPCSEDYIMIAPGKRFEDARRATKEAIARYPADCVPHAVTLEDSSHRDGSIYKATSGWPIHYCIANRDETRLEPMVLSEPSDCWPNRETCISHSPCPMLQILSLKLAEIPYHGGSVELYGYVAVRDDTDPLLNYIFNCSRDDPIVVEQGLTPYVQLRT